MNRRFSTPRPLATAALAAALLAGSGCRALVELVETDPAAATVDGGGPPPDAPTDWGDAGIVCTGWDYSPAHVDPCDLPVPDPDLVLGPGMWTYDTNSGALTDPQLSATFPASVLLAQAGGPELRVVSVQSLDVQNGAILRATGERPLVIVSWSDLTVAGTIDVGGSVGDPGAGANPSACPNTGPQDGTDSTEGASGGGGGGFASAGGDGGTGSSGVAAAGTGGAAIALPAYLRGGCPGGRGGNSLAGPAGNGGGAVHLLARDSITIDGVLNAGGNGGGGSSGNRSGGSGGGSGGLIDLQADIVHLGSTAVLAANGGGGGGGSDNKVAGDGQDGQADETAALGGDGEGMGAPGGNGAFAQTSAMPGEMANRGGGGGGGGIGFVVVHASTLDDGGAVISPPTTSP